MTTAPPPSDAAIARIRSYVAKYRRKTGTSAHPNAAVTESVVLGLAQNVDEVGRPLCPCNFYLDKQTDVEQSRRWVCACDEMKQYKYCHCLLFVTPEGLPITEHLPDGHEGREIYGVVNDPAPDKGREARRHVEAA
ncbi:MAG: ferredoxin:thioredoxin reductase [Planctomycetes bacterium]|nr:ferredoxin:thioredoxin reductase [Planctomycetia bacterium]MBI3464691.1 ferredoxin:thioredoxin reductase [Planctomycetota bacterium]